MLRHGRGQQQANGDKAALGKTGGVFLPPPVTTVGQRHEGVRANFHSGGELAAELVQPFALARILWAGWG
jgi:hypothetical protein